ncbi:procathepsin L [Episyrphus balteatus]|uniref:procathepsin L n=1 Tax=Episyrphus balteatus TaxID=286459 RepID=UPI0024851E60|nr:procathepsin L [Episyrphus balteatus]
MSFFGLGLLVSFIVPADFIRSGCSNYQLSSDFPRLEHVNSFDEFIDQTGRQYSNEFEKQMRETIFVTKKNLIDVTNKAFENGLSTFALGINPFADRTLVEYSRLHGSKISLKGEQRVGKHRNYLKKNSVKDLPDNFDWRELGGVTSAKFQGADCGSCWSFAVIGALEGHLFRKTGFLVPLSAQDLIDCAESYGNNGCEGGFQEYGFDYIVEHGIALDTRYPYTQMENPQCHHNETGIGIKIRDYASIKPGDEERMKEVIATLGPIACSMQASLNSFQLYKGGLYTDDECNKGEVNHSVVVVGYGQANGRDYWIIKNSYSPNWGENGFMKLPRNEDGFCGIASECSYPVL